MFARLARVTQEGFQVITQQIALQCGEVLRSAALQESIDAIKTAVHDKTWLRPRNETSTKRISRSANAQ